MATKVKKIVLYVIAFIIVWFGASYVASHYIDYAEVIDLSDEMLYAVALRDEAVLEEYLQEALRLQAEEAEVDEVVYTLGDSDPQILEMKIKLYYAGYLDSEPMGEDYDAALSKAVELYQRDNEMDASGDITEKTLERLLDAELILNPGQSGTLIQRYLDILYNLDYLTEAPNMLFDAAGEAAVRAYQEEQLLTINGLLDEATCARLDEEKYTYRTGMRGEDIAALQEMLITLGYMEAQADGIYASGTEEAVSKFQEDNDILVSGEMDEYTKLEIRRQVEALEVPDDGSGNND